MVELTHPVFARAINKRELDFGMAKNILLFFLIYSCVFPVSAQKKKGAQTFTIAFGSCAEEDKPQPILDRVVRSKPDLFIYLGDNIYGDTYDMKVLGAKYDTLAAKPEFQRLKAAVPIIATWDDHDYGANDSGKEYPYKKESKEMFLKFFAEPSQSARYRHEGIYTSYVYERAGKKIQVILLDGRTFRNRLRLYRGEHNAQEKYFYPLDYYPHEIEDSTLLGAEQWKWLEGELRKPADVRIIGSGTQFGITYNGYEAWANYPHEQKRLLDLIKRTGANGVFFLSGDVHYAELSKLEREGQYPIYDLTSSGITSTWHFATPNDNRIEGPIMDNHFGLVTINFSKPDPEIRMEIWDVRGNQRIEYTFPLSSISF
jgi:alkaline phosphatase D